MKKEAAAKQVGEDAKVAAGLDIENAAHGEKIVEDAKREAASIKNAKESGGAVDFVSPGLAGIVGEEAAKALDAPVDPPAGADAKKEGWVPPELAGPASLA